MTTAQQRQAMGRYGEDRALRHLVSSGMVVLDRNWRCEFGEVDLVLRDGDVLVVCEVKTRATAAFEAAPFKKALRAATNRPPAT